MLSFILRRLVQAVLSFLLLTYAVWFLTTQDGFVALQHLQFNTLLPQHYLTWLQQVLQGDLGYSIRNHSTVLDAVRGRAVITLALLVPAFLLQELIALLIGVTAAARQGSLFDRISSNLVFIFASLPVFWLALIAIILFSVKIHWFPTSGLVNLFLTGASWNTPEYWQYFHAHTWQAIGDIAHHLELPILIIVLVNAAADIWKHAFRNAMLPLITNIGVQVPRLVFTVAIIEYTFSIPGLGELFISAVYTPITAGHGHSGTVNPKDFNVVAAYFLILGAVAILWTIATDITYAFADPRMRQSITSGAAAGPAWRGASWNSLLRTRISFTVGQFAVALAVVAVAVLGYSILRPGAATTNTADLSGVWSGQMTVTFSFTNLIGTVNSNLINGDACMVLHVAPNNTITGSAVDGGDLLFFGGSQVSGTFTIQGKTDGDSVQLAWITTSNNSGSYNLQGGFPDKDAIKLNGIYSIHTHDYPATVALTRLAPGTPAAACTGTPSGTPTPVVP
jgi:peptide/nickel transport system permease protein